MSILGNYVNTVVGNISNRVLGVPTGAQSISTLGVSLSINQMKGSDLPDLRVKIRVPQTYLSGDIVSSHLNPGEMYGGALTAIGGIVFPYTPSISLEYKADYTATPVTHSNYTLNFYQRSSVSPITISGKFTVQNDADAMIYLDTITLLKALTKMRFGGSESEGIHDADSGAPPPVCRLDAYGSRMINNVPVVISAAKFSLPDNVDYYTVDNEYGSASVPTMSTLEVTCIPMYSRAEMQKASVSGWIEDLGTNGVGVQAGYL